MGLTTARARCARHGRLLLAATLTLASTLGMPLGSAHAALSPLGDNYSPQGTAYDASSGTLYSAYGDGFVCRVVAVGSTGVVRLVAGSGLCGYSGDGGPATAAEIEESQSLAVDASGNVYAAGGYGVRRISPTGTITNYAGKHEIACLVEGRPMATVGAVASTVGIYSFAIAISPISGHLFVVDACTRSILEIDESDTIVARYAGTFPNEVTSSAIAFDAEGDLYFVSGEGKTVRKMTPEGRFSAFAGNGTGGIEGNGGPATLAQLDGVAGLAVDSRGVVFVSASGSLRLYVRQVRPEGTIEALAGLPWPNESPFPTGTLARSSGFFSVGQLAVDDSDNVYLSGWSDHTLFSIRGPAEGNSPVSWILHEKVQSLVDDRQGGGNPSENTCDQGCVGDPVSTATGEYSETTTDLAIPGRGPALSFARTYSSLAGGEGGPLGRGWTGSYFMSASVDEAGVVTIRQENGSRISFEPNGRGGYFGVGAYLATLTAREGGGWTLTRRGHDRFVFDAEGRLVRELDPNEVATTLSYEGGALVRATDAAGRTLTFGYDEARHLSEVRDSAGRVVRYGYTGSDLTSVVDARGQTWTYAYDGAHRLLSRTDPNRHLDVRNDYDAAGRVSRQTDAREGVTRFSYRPGMTQVTSPGGRVRQDWYASGQLIKRVDAAGAEAAATWKYEYDPVTHGTTKITDPNGHVWRATYNAAGLQTSTTDPLEHTTRSTYDELGDRLTFEDANHVTTTWAYDERGNLLSESTPLTGTESRQVTTFTHGDERHPADITAIEDPRRKTTQLRYDASGNLASITDPEGDRTTMTYDEAGNLRTVVSPLGNVEGGRPEQHTTTYSHDAAGALTQVTDPLSHVTRLAYDPAGNLESATDARRNLTTYGYDAADLLTAIHRADESTLRRAYDADGHLESTTDGAGNATRYAYDDLGLLRSVTDPRGRVTSYQHDGAGNATSVVDPQRRTTTYGYDEANGLTSISYSDRTTPSVTYRYDADGQRTSMTDGNGTTSYSWDSLHRLRQFTEGGTTVSYGYDLANDLTSIVYPSGTVTRTFDEAGRLSSVTDWLRGTTRFAYDADSRLARTTFPAAAEDVDSYTYDSAGGMLTATLAHGATTLARLTYTRDANEQQSSVSQTGLPGSAAIRTGYTALNQLSFHDIRNYEFDHADNLTRIASAGPLAYDEANELREGPVPPGRTGTTTFGYDQDGNRTSATPEGLTASTYGYDQADRLVRFTPPSGRGATYAYNGDGLRTAKTPSRLATQHFVWDQSAGLPLLLADATNSYLYGPDGTPIEQIDGSRAPTYLHTDALGSTRLLTEARGVATGTFTYAPYGTLTGSTGTATTPLGFAGQYTDVETGFQYLRARYMDAATGQFLTRDPLTAITGLPYAYTGGNPVNEADPRGLFFGLPSPSDILHAALDAAAVPPYLAYYGAYQGAHVVNDVGSVFGGIGSTASHAYALQFVPIEAVGLGGDVIIDWIKSKTVSDESICDEGHRGYVNPFHEWLPGPLKGPKTYLPGVHQGGRVDIAW